MDSIETVVSEERSVQEPKTIANSNIAQQITTQLEKSKPKNSKDEKQKHVKWRGQLSAYEINPLLQVYSKLLLVEY